MAETGKDTMYGDTEVLRRRVDQLREQAVDIRALADQLVAQTELTGWTGRAAESMTVRVAERAAHLRVAATQHDVAADSLAKHLHDVETLQEAIADTEKRVGVLVAEARTRLADVEGRNETAEGGVRVEPDADDVTLAAFDPPPPGHRDWLTIELPGHKAG